MAKACVRLPWDVAYRIMRLATTATDGKIQRTTRGLPIGFCLASKSDVLAKVAAAREERLAGQLAHVAERVGVAADGGLSGDGAAGASDGRADDAGAANSLAAVDAPGEPGSIAVDLHHQRRHRRRHHHHQRRHRRRHHHHQYSVVAASR